MNAPKVRAWLCLVATVLLEILATLALKAADGFTLLLPSVVSITGYCATIVMLAFALKEIPMSVAYVIWTGVGTSGVALLGTVIFADHLSPTAWAGVILVIGGVVLINAKKRAPGTGEESRAAEEHAQRSRSA